MRSVYVLIGAAKRKQGIGAGGRVVLMQVLNMQCVSDLTGYGRGGM